MRKVKYIECPYCGYQYLPEEIYVPTGFFGKPRAIEREYSGRILDFIGDSLNINEKYICDKCSQQFNIKAKINFEVTKSTKYNINEDYTIQLKKKQLILDED